ncbi:MAG: hypothetical protein Q7T53_09165 [Deltaproteobacteria bacterium]|nr:hypothetical protein [Deltaproteobacteria bacterium]
MLRPRKYISLMILVAFSLQGCASQELRHTREGDLYKTEKMSSRTETSYKISATSPTQIKVTERTDTYETHRRYYEGMEDVTTKEVSWTAGTYGLVMFGTVMTAGILLVAIALKPEGIKRNSQAALISCSHDGQIIEGFKCSISTESKKTGSYIKKNEEALLDSNEAVVTSGNVMVSINGRPVKDVSIQPDGTAELDLFKFPELARTKKDVNIEYRYRNAVISTTLESAVSYAAKRIVSEIMSKGWKVVAIAELSTEGMPADFRESIYLELSQNKKVSVVKKDVISVTFERLETNFADLMAPTNSGIISDIRKQFGKWTGADGIIGSKVTKKDQTAGMKKWPDIFETEGIQIDVQFVDIEKGKIYKKRLSEE